MTKKSLYSMFFVILLVTEFYYIEIGDGIARIYHFLTPLVLMSLAKYIPYLFKSRVFLAIAAFWCVNLVSALLANTYLAATASFLSLTANITIAVVTALILLSHRINIEFLKKIILGVTVVSVIWGLVQVAVFNLFNLSLGLSGPQDIQILSGFGPGFRTEANTFAKYLNFVFLLYLPGFVGEKLNVKNILILCIIVVGMLINFTRSALYGLGVTLVLYFFWYLVKGRFVLISRKMFVVAWCCGCFLIIYISFAGDVNQYVLFKVQNFFNIGEIFYGGSSGFRLMSQNVLLDSFLMTDKSMIIGHGWGQVKYYYRHDLWQAGGGEFITILAYGGICAGLTYILYIFSAIVAAYKKTQIYRDQREGHTYEGVMFAILGLFITGQVSGYLIAPEYWLLIGIAMYLDVGIYHMYSVHRSTGSSAMCKRC